MLVGKGLIAGSFLKYADKNEFLVFAAGVSNSKSCTQEDFKREKDSLSDAILANPYKKVVYFSSTSMHDPDLAQTPYILHKHDMESLVRKMASKYHVFRLSNLAGKSSHPHTLLNFFYNRITQGLPFELWKNSERNVIDVEDMSRIADHILRNGLFIDSAVNIANAKNYPVRYIVECIENYTGKEAIFSEKQKGDSFSIDISDIQPICRKLGIEFGQKYLPRLLEKYYPKP
jgi:nucleoside-diphosphate-sugar epimerase